MSVSAITILLLFYISIKLTSECYYAVQINVKRSNSSASETEIYWWNGKNGKNSLTLRIVNWKDESWRFGVLGANIICWHLAKTI